jgi:SAM-dependent methyltransferase
VTWELFERGAARYEGWYATPRGRRASEAETRLLAALIEPFRARTVLEIGCGTGHFTRWLAERGYRPIGLDRSGAMLAELRRLPRPCPVVRGDAHALPFGDGAVDLALLVTTLEFLHQPARALGEAARVARQGIVVVVLNRWSAGGVRRRIQRGSTVSRARDLSLCALRRVLGRALGDRPARLRWSSALLPRPLPSGPTRIPLGDVLGASVSLAATRAAP